MKKKTINFLVYISLPIIILAIWEFASLSGALPAYIIPAPHSIVELGIDLLKSGELWKHISVSIRRVFSGFAIAACVAIVFGVFIALSKTLENFTKLILQVLQPISPIAWIPIAIIWLGIGDPSKIFITFIGSVFPILINTIDGIRQIDNRYIEVSKTFEVPYPKLVGKVFLVGAFPQILTGLKIGLGNAWFCVVASEMIAASSGVGYMLMDGRALSQPERVMLAMIVIGAIGALMRYILERIEKRFDYAR